MSIETRQGSFQFPAAADVVVPSTRDEMEAAIAVLQEQKQA